VAGPSLADIPTLRDGLAIAQRQMGYLADAMQKSGYVPPVTVEGWRAWVESGAPRAVSPNTLSSGASYANSNINSYAQYLQKVSEYNARFIADAYNSTRATINQLTQQLGAAKDAVAGTVQQGVATLESGAAQGVTFVEQHPVESAAAAQGARMGVQAAAGQMAGTGAAAGTAVGEGGAVLGTGAAVGEGGAVPGTGAAVGEGGALLGTGAAAGEGMGALATAAEGASLLGPVGLAVGAAVLLGLGLWWAASRGSSQPAQSSAAVPAPVQEPNPVTSTTTGDSSAVLPPPVQEPQPVPAAQGPTIPGTYDLAFEPSVNNDSSCTDELPKQFMVQVGSGLSIASNPLDGGANYQFTGALPNSSNTFSATGSIQQNGLTLGTGEAYFPLKGRFALDGSDTVIRNGEMDATGNASGITCSYPFTGKRRAE